MPATRTRGPASPVASKSPESPLSSSSSAPFQLELHHLLPGGGSMAKLYRVLSTPGNKPVIAWDDSGTMIYVLDAAALPAALVPEFGEMALGAFYDKMQKHGFRVESGLRRTGGMLIQVPGSKTMTHPVLNRAYPPEALAKLNMKDALALAGQTGVGAGSASEEEGVDRAVARRRRSSASGSPSTSGSRLSPLAGSSATRDNGKGKQKEPSGVVPSNDSASADTSDAPPCPPPPQALSDEIPELANIFRLASDPSNAAILRCNPTHTRLSLIDPVQLPALYRTTYDQPYVARFKEWGFKMSVVWDAELGKGVMTWWRKKKKSRRSSGQSEKVIAAAVENDATDRTSSSLSPALSTQTLVGVAVSLTDIKAAETPPTSTSMEIDIEPSLTSNSPSHSLVSIPLPPTLVDGSGEPSSPVSTPTPESASTPIPRQNSPPSPQLPPPPPQPQEKCTFCHATSSFEWITVEEVMYCLRCGLQVLAAPAGAPHWNLQARTVATSS
ncbi:hypothetical protein MKEN_00214800 [Mycena kentingensis (nom. inval.)]|nr:hypothetical protein MKEN_00214800 [Mycena kentingensis (nom. inval.)]